MVQTLGNGLFVPATLRELVENASNNGYLPFITECQRNALVLNALPFARSEDLDRLTGLVEQEAAKAVSGFTAGPVALLGNLHTTAKHLVAQFAAVLRGTEAFELDIDRIEWIVLPRFAERRVDDLLAVFPALGAVLGGQIDVLEPAPAADVQAQDVLEVVPLFTQFSIMSWKPGRPSAVSPDLPGSMNSWMISTPLLSAQGRTWSC